MTTIGTADLRLDTSYALFSDAGRKSRPLMAVERQTHADLHSIRSVAVRASPFEAAFCQLARFRDLAAGWDSYGAQRIEPKALETASRLLHSLSDSALERATTFLAPYHVAPIPNGGLQMEWRRDGRLFELWIGPDGSLEAVLDDPIAGLAEKKYLTVSSAASGIEAVIG